MKRIDNCYFIAWLVLLACCAATDGFASGFGLYEASSATYALGGAVLGRAVDASANFHNPATLTDLTNVTLTAGVLTEHPRARMKVGGDSSTAMDPGCFWLPHVHAAVPLPLDFTFGLGVMPEYGLGSSYDDTWELANNSLDTTVMSFTVNPNLAYKITDDWSIGAGPRFLFFDFEQYSRPLTAAGRFDNRLWGDNRMGDIGWQIGTSYRVFDNFAVGAVYKSSTIVNVKGKTDNEAAIPAAQVYADAASGTAETELELPQSVTGGFNWDLTDDLHLGGMLAWTQWSSIGVLNFDLAGMQKDIYLRWDDTYRVGLAPSWDFAENWSLLSSYVFETDCCGDQESTMLPAAQRHMATLGLAWRCLEQLELDLCYGLIIMDGKDSHARDATGELVTYRPYRGISHAVGFSVTYRF